MELCETDKKFSEGCDEKLQLLNILLYTNRIVQGKIEKIHI